MRTQRKKHSRLWVYLLYLGLVTSLILSVTLARYVSTAEGTGTATVAAVAVDGAVIEPEPITMPLEGLVPGKTETLKFKVVNFIGSAVSEVALEYEVKVETTGNLPLEFALAADEGENRARTPKTELEAGTVAAVTGGAFPLTGGEQAHTYTLTVTWPADADKMNAGYADEIDLVTITVTARQKVS